MTAAAALAALGGVWSTLEVDAVTLLRLDRFGDATRWLPIAAYGLGGPLVRGRGGLEIELYRSAVVDPETEAVLGGRVDPVPPGAVRWSVTARVGGIVVGAACGFVRGGAVSLDTLVVDPRTPGSGSPRGWSSSQRTTRPTRSSCGRARR